MATAGFIQTFGDCGLRISLDDDIAAGRGDVKLPHELDCDQAVFLKRLRKKLTGALDYPENASRIVEELVAYLEGDEDNPRSKKGSTPRGSPGNVSEFLLRALRPTKTSSEGRASGARGSLQDSLVRLALSVEELQPRLASWLLEKLAMVALEDEDQGQPPTSGTQGAAESANIPMLILYQLRWLDKIANGQELTDKLLEVLEAAPEGVQLEIIACLPHIVGGSGTDSDKIVLALRDKMGDRPNSRITSVIVDAFTNLPVDRDVLDQLTNSALDTLPWVRLDRVPVFLKFILQSVRKGEELDVVTRLRSELDLSPPAFLKPPTNVTQQHQPHPPLSSTAAHASGDPVGCAGGNDDDVSLIVDTLKTYLVTSNKKMADAWFRGVELAKGPAEHKPLDLFVLLLLHGLPGTRKKAVESLWKNKLRSGHFGEELFKKAFRSHGGALRSHFDELMAMADSLMMQQQLLQPEPVLRLFSTVMHREMFLAFDRHCQLEILADLVTKVSSGCHETARACALGTLEHLAHNHADKLVPHSTFLAGVLDHLHGLELSQVRQVMDVLSLVAYHNAGQDGQGSSSSSSLLLRDDLHIVIRKQISAGDNSRLKQMGVIGTLVMVKNMTTTYGDQSESRRKDIPVEWLKQAKEMLERVKKSLRNNGKIASLFMDELARVVQSQGVIHKSLMEWITSSASNDFQTDHVVDITANDLKKGHQLRLPSQQSSAREALPLTLQYSLETDQQHEQADDDDNREAVGIAINLGQTCAGWLVEKFIPHFRLLAACNGDKLDEIDALLVCPLWLPAVPEDVRAIAHLPGSEKDRLCNTLFYALNWFLELLNAFAACQGGRQGKEDESADEYRKKVLLRLKQVLEVQDNLRNCLQNNQTFVPPSASALADVSGWQTLACLAAKSAKRSSSSGTKKQKSGWKISVKGIKGRKRKLSDSTNLPIIDTQQQLQQKQSQVSQGADENDDDDATRRGTGAAAAFSLDVIRHFAPFFRELDMEVFSILGYDKMNVGSKGSEQEEFEDPKLRPPELLFLLRDLSAKLERSLVATGPKGRRFGAGEHSAMSPSAAAVAVRFAKLDQLGPQRVASKTADLLCYVLTHLEEIAAYFAKMIEINDGVIDGNALFGGDQTFVLISCVEQALSVLRILFGWIGFQAKDQRPLLETALLILAQRKTLLPSTTQLPLGDLVKAALDYLKGFSGSIMNLACADELAKTMDAVASHLSDNTHQKEQEYASKAIADRCEGFLKREWVDLDTGGKDKGAKFNVHVDSLLKLFFNNTRKDRDRSAAISCYVGAVTEMLDKAGLASSTSYPTLTRQGTLGLHYRLLLQYLVVSVKDLTFGVTKDHGELLERWQEAVVQLHDLVMVVKSQHKNRLLIGALIRSSRMFVDYFLRHGMLLMDRLFRRKRPECVALLKDLQLSTRYLQHVCSHSKLLRDVALSNQVPALKKSLETFVFRVKAMLVLNDAAEAFWLGNLKNRNLKGEEIRSQGDTGSISTESREDEDEVGGEEEDEQLPDEDQSEIELSGEDQDSGREGGAGAAKQRRKGRSQKVPRKRGMSSSSSASSGDEAALSTDCEADEDNDVSALVG